MHRIRDLPARSKPRERLLSAGVHALSDAELVALIIGTGNEDESAIDLAHRMLARIPLSKIGQGVGALRQFSGMGLAKSCALVAACEIGRRAKVPEKVSGASPQEIVAAVSYLANEHQEHFVALYLDVRKRILCTKTLFVGTLDAIVVHPREIFSHAYTQSAAGVVLVHNHPSGEPDPSDEDIRFTRQVVKAGRLLHIEVVDHVIVASQGYFSFVEHGMLGCL